LCVITSIDLDHTEFLGETIEAITYEKAGIIKPKVPVVIGPSVSQEIIHAVADKLQSRVYQVSGTFETYDQENTELASTALNLLSIPPEIIQKGIQTLPHCRFEIFNKKKLSSLFKSIAVPEALILDVAHNPAGLRRLLNEVQLKFPEKPIIFLCGFSKNKDIRECLKLLKESGTYFYPAAAKNERAASPDFLKKQLLDLGVPKERIFTKESLKDSLEGSLNHAAINNGIVVISGTFFIMGEVREFLGIEEPKDLLNLN
jgi:dihydrofolate synthase/folylpolyglutamate synthase